VWNWYLVVLLLGWMVFPMVRLALKSLPDRGFAFARLIGLLLVAFLAWWAGSLGIAYSRVTITGVIIALLAVNLILAILQRKGLQDDIKTHWKLFLCVEGIFLVFSWQIWPSATTTLTCGIPGGAGKSRWTFLISPR